MINHIREQSNNFNGVWLTDNANNFATWMTLLQNYPLIGGYITKNKTPPPPKRFSYSVLLEVSYHHLCDKRQNSWVYMTMYDEINAIHLQEGPLTWLASVIFLWWIPLTIGTLNEYGHNWNIWKKQWFSRWNPLSHLLMYDPPLLMNTA